MSRQLLTPSPSPPPPVPTPTLPAQINAATKKQHVVLNRLLVDRLPLALPPNAPDPRLFGYGLSVFATIYFVFESCWKELFDSVETDDKSLTGTHDAQVRRWLATLVPPGLSRTSRLAEDLKDISSRIGTNARMACSGQREILEQMRSEIRAKPHTLLAYGWVMYMAIFSGGRWIRQQLCKAGVEFWTGDSKYSELNEQEIQKLELFGLSFLYFDGDHDGEDIKVLFKARLAEAETLLSAQERQDVIDASQLLFTRCIGLVGMIDRNVWWRYLPARIMAALPWILGAVVLLFVLWIR